MRGVRETLWFAPVFLSAFIMLSNLSEAAVIFEQPLSSATTTNATHAFFKLPAGISAPYGLESIELIASANAIGHAFESVVICRVNANYTGNCPEMPDFSIRTGSQPVTKTPTNYTLRFGTGSTTPLVASRYYAFGIIRSGGDAAGIDLRGVTTTNTCIIAGCGLSGSPFVILTAKDEEKEIDPVIIIPGILGSEKNSDGVWVIDPILHTYDDLIATLDVNHYTPEVDLFTFPYNWRKSNVETAVLLKEKIDEVKAICNCEKVDLVAHSMGGLVARQYIQSDAYEDDVDQLIFLGTPHLGAPKAYLMWEGGEVGPFFPIGGTLMEKILELEAEAKGYTGLFDYLHNHPIDSVRELLPVYDYIFDGNNVQQYPTNYPTNHFLEDLKDNVNQLLNSDVRTYNFIGETGSQNTITGIQAVQTAQYAPKWQHGYPENYYEILGNHGLLLGSGDETVPIGSASFVDSNLTTTLYGHSALPAGTQGDVYHILAGETAATLSHKYDSTRKKMLHILMHSPADLLVIDPEGKKIGKENGQEINQISGAFYTGFNTDTEFITILNPLDGEYKVVAEGTSSGSYTVETAFISEQQAIEASFTGNTIPGLFIELNVPVNNANPEAFTVEPEDTDPPVITILQPEARDYPRSEQLPIHVSAHDTSGVFALESKLGTTTIPNVAITDLFFQKLGQYHLIASSTDNIGNATTSMRVFRVIATPASMLSDIDRAYQLGWMIQSVRDKLRDKLQTYITKLQQTKRADKFILKDILNELERQKGKGINEQGYQLLKEDILWLISN